MTYNTFAVTRDGVFSKNSIKLLDLIGDHGKNILDRTKIQQTYFYKKLVTNIIKE